MRLLLDADATLALSRLSLWELLLTTDVDLLLTGYIAKHELSSMWSAKLESLVAEGRVALHEVRVKTPAYAKWRELQRAGADKGEAEAIAWAVCEPKATRPWFVSADHRARKLAANERLEAFDLGDLAARLILAGALPEAAVIAKIAVWDDNRQQQGRPVGWVSVRESLPERMQRSGPRGG